MPQIEIVIHTLGPDALVWVGIFVVSALMLLSILQPEQEFAAPVVDHTERNVRVRK